MGVFWANWPQKWNRGIFFGGFILSLFTVKQSTDEQLAGEEPQTGTRWLNSSFSSETSLKAECTAVCSTVAGKWPVNQYSWSETTFLPPMCHLNCEMHLKPAGQLSFENVSESLKTLLIVCTDWRIELNWMTNCLNMHANRCLHVLLRETVVVAFTHDSVWMHKKKNTKKNAIQVHFNPKIRLKLWEKGVFCITSMCLRYIICINLI